MLLLGGTLTAVVISEGILKPLIGRLRYGHLTFPSGHTTAIAAIASATAILLIGAQRPRGVALRLWASLAAIVVAASVAIALVAQHVHYATDIAHDRSLDPVTKIRTEPSVRLPLA